MDGYALPETSRRELVVDNVRDDRTEDFGTVASWRRRRLWWNGLHRPAEHRRRIDICTRRLHLQLQSAAEVRPKCGLNQLEDTMPRRVFSVPDPRVQTKRQRDIRGERFVVLRNAF